MAEESFVNQLEKKGRGGQERRTYDVRSYTNDLDDLYFSFSDKIMIGSKSFVLRRMTSHTTDR